MTSTFMAIYRPGPAWKPGIPIRDQPPAEHGRYLLGLFARGTLQSAGPFTDDSGAAVILNAEDENSAAAIVADDPAIAAGIFICELHRWAPVPWDQYLQRV